jgi:hypothetical protein
MKASEAKMLEFLKKSPQFVIPIYQRTYSRTEREASIPKVGLTKEELHLYIKKMALE